MGLQPPPNTSEEGTQTQNASKCWSKYLAVGQQVGQVVWKVGGAIPGCSHDCHIERF